jgi:hypothetical protein
LCLFAPVGTALELKMTRGATRVRFGSNDGPIATLLSWGMRNGALQAAAFLLAEDRNVKGVSTGATGTEGRRRQ